LSTGLGRQRQRVKRKGEDNDLEKHILSTKGSLREKVWELHTIRRNSQKSTFTGKKLSCSEKGKWPKKKQRSETWVKKGGGSKG